MMIVDPEGEDISIDTIRDASRFLMYSPEYSKRKYVIIYDADRMNQQAANAFLKTLEEPPRYGTIILTTTRWYYLLPTMRSRVVRFSINPSPVKEERHPWIVTIAEHNWRAREQLKNARKKLEKIESLEDEKIVKILLGKSNTLELYLAAFEILKRLSNSDESRLVKMIDLISSKFSGKDFFRLNAILSEAALWLMEIHEIWDLENARFFDSISRARMANFNNLLTLYNIAIRYKEMTRGDEAWNSQQPFTESNSSR